MFFLNKSNFKGYFISAVSIFILYIPHIPVFRYQFGIGGVGGAEGWLGKPQSDWLWKYIQYCFNDSTLLMSLFFLFFLISLIVGYKTIKLTKFHILSLLFFIVPFIIGYSYSVYRNPILQFSILIFSFPFLLMFLFSFIRPERKLLNYLFLFIF